jgi:hypothetical protein
MVNASVNATTPSGNDIPSLAQIFAASLQYYCKHNSPLVRGYIDKLNTIVGLGFTAVMVDGGLLSNYQPYLSTFLSNIRIKEKTGDIIHVLSLAVAKMVAWAVDSFRRIHHPDYYPSFVNAVKEAVMRVGVHGAKKEKEAIRLLKVLFGG